MANLKEIKLQIASVKNTQKTTKAMKLVSSAKLTRARTLFEHSKSYEKKINKVLSDIANRIAKLKEGGNTNRAFLENSKPKIVDIVFVTADKGLCAGFNILTIKKILKLMKEYEALGATVRLRIAGKKGLEYFKFQEQFWQKLLKEAGKHHSKVKAGFINIDILDSVADLSSSPDYDRATDFIDGAVNDFFNEKTDKVILVHNGFLNMLTQKIYVKNLLPVEINSLEKSEDDNSMLEIEPDDDESVLTDLTSKYVHFNMYYALLDSLAAEHSARMQAMDSATNNARDKVNTLTVEYNKARQAAITTELIEIISGVEALK